MTSPAPAGARRPGPAPARWVTSASLVAAGVAALQAPAPWPWVGMGGLALGVVSLALRYRTHRRERSAAETRIEELEADALELSRSRDLYGSLLSSLPVGVVAVQSGQAVYANPAAVEVLGERVTQADAPMPGAVRDVIDGALSGRSSSAQFSQGLPRRVMEVAARPVGEGLVLLHLSDITERSRIDRMRQDFVIAASHEHKTPVAAIRAAAETVLMVLE